MRVFVVNCGSGNIRSVVKALEHVGFSCVGVSQDPEEVKTAEVLVFPGQGAFRRAMENLTVSGMAKVILRHVESGKPFLGICLGLQLLFERSYEHGKTEGLGVLRGEVTPLPPGVKLPHIGWNQVRIRKRSPMFEGIEDGDYFYFVHSYRVVPEESHVIASTTDYGEEFVSAISVENLWGVQFHPEKSQRKGLRLLENFRRFCEKTL
ncbi:MAG: imidazole glycerol phosphate synthase subunit HisH [Aquificota bacterium]|nr:imidazole glycerol phosphate synthase subunit HisH [Aquificota bacterium]